jgi:hypothetical protein
MTNLEKIVKEKDWEMDEDCFKEWIKKKVAFYSPYLSVQLQSIRIERSDKTNDPEDYLSIACTYPYLDPTIWFSATAFQDWGNGKMSDDRILHELCHIITDPLYAKANSRYVSKNEILDERERLIDTICMIVRNLIK